MVDRRECNLHKVARNLESPRKRYDYEEAEEICTKMLDNLRVLITEPSISEFQMQQFYEGHALVEYDTPKPQGMVVTMYLCEDPSTI